MEMATNNILKKVLVGLREIDKRFLKNIIVYLYFKLMVPEERVELSLPKEHDFESCASTNSATRAQLKNLKIFSANFQILVLRFVSSLCSEDYAPKRFARELVTRAQLAS